MEEILRIFTLNYRDALMILISAGLFFTFWKSIENLVFKDFFRLIEKREKDTVGALHEAESMLKKVSEINLNFEKTLQETRALSLKDKEKKIATAQVEANKILSDTQLQAEKIIKDGKVEVKRSIAEISSQLAVRSDDLAATIFQKVTSVN